MNIVMKTAAAILAAAAITGATGEFTKASASTAAAGSAAVTLPVGDDGNRLNDDEVNAAASRGVVVTNMSGNTMRLTSVVGDHWFEGRPADNAEIKPGDEHRWEMQLQYLKQNNETVTYDLIRPDGSVDGQVTFHMRLSTGFFGEVAQETTCKSNTSKDGVTCATSTSAVTLTDPAGMIRNLDGSGRNAAAIDVLQRMCNTGRATCEFKATSQEKRLGPAKQMGSKTGNVVLDMLNKSITVSDSWGSSDSLGGSVSLTIPIGPVQVALQATYEHTWTKTHTFEDTVEVPIRVNHWGWVEQRAPYVRHIGTFVVKFNNVTWQINNVAIDSPDTTREAVTLARTEPMTPEEIEDAKDNKLQSAGGLVVETAAPTTHVVGEK